MTGDKTVERRLTKREPIGHSKTSLNPDSAHCIVEAQTKMRSSKMTRFTSNLKKTLERSLFLEYRSSGNTSSGYLTGNKFGHDRAV